MNIRVWRNYEEFLMFASRSPNVGLVQSTDAKSHLLRQIYRVQSPQAIEKEAGRRFYSWRSFLMGAISVADAGAIRILPPVGPAEPEQAGYLVVYTATEPVNDGDVMYYTHTDYKLYSSSGVFLKTIRNSIVKGDEVPETVRLAPGHYVIHAQSETEGYVAVPS